MNKSPEAFRTISEVAETLDVPPHVLRFWETRFTQVKPVKRGGGRRYYRPEDVRLLRGIRGLLYDDGMTIKGVQKILRERGVRHVIGLGTVPETEAEAETEPQPEAAPAPPPEPKAKPRPSAPANGAGPVPQPDLFDATAARSAPASAGAGPAPLDKPALRVLLGELMALRAVMTDDSAG
jgi:DNA-binding transcriptional MerR regulator